MFDISQLYWLHLAIFWRLYWPHLEIFAIFWPYLVDLVQLGHFLPDFFLTHFCPFFNEGSANKKYMEMVLLFGADVGI